MLIIISIFHTFNYNSQNQQNNNTEEVRGENTGTGVSQQDLQISEKSPEEKALKS